MKVFSVSQKHLNCGSVDERNVLLVQAHTAEEALSSVKSEYEPHEDDRYEYDEVEEVYWEEEKILRIYHWDDR